MALMVALGLMTGLQGEIRSQILGATAHVSIFRSGNEPFDDYREVVEKVRRLPHVLGRRAHRLRQGPAHQASGSAVATLKGIVPDEETTVTDLASQVGGGTAGGPRVPRRGRHRRRILLGRDLAASLGVGVGDVVTVTSPAGAALARWACCRG